MRYLHKVLILGIVILFFLFLSKSQSFALWSKPYDLQCAAYAKDNPCSYGIFTPSGTNTCKLAPINSWCGPVGGICTNKTGDECKNRPGGEGEGYTYCVNTNTIYNSDGTPLGIDPCPNEPTKFRYFQFYQPPPPCVETGPRWNAACTAKSSTSCGPTGGIQFGDLDCAPYLTYRDCDIGVINCDASEPKCETCQNGTCQNTAVNRGCTNNNDCDDKNNCTIDTCTTVPVCGKTVGTCSHTNENSTAAKPKACEYNANSVPIKWCCSGYCGGTNSSCSGPTPTPTPAPSVCGGTCDNNITCAPYSKCDNGICKFDPSCGNTGCGEYCPYDADTVKQCSSSETCLYSRPPYGDCAGDYACVPPQNKNKYMVTVYGRVLITDANGNSTGQCYVGTVALKIKANGSNWAKTVQFTQDSLNCSEKDMFGTFSAGNYTGTYTISIPNPPAGYSLTVSTATITVP